MSKVYVRYHDYSYEGADIKFATLDRDKAFLAPGERWVEDRVAVFEDEKEIEVWEWDNGQWELTPWYKVRLKEKTDGNPDT